MKTCTPIFRLPPYRAGQQLLTLAETVDWGLSAYGIPDVWRRSRGAGVKVAVLDTGIDLEHPDLAEAVDAVRDFTRSLSGAHDRQGHGTHVAGTLAARQNGVGVIGVAPECRLLVAKVLGDDGSGSDASVAAGVDWAVESGADVVSMSLGSAEASPRIGAAIRRAAAAGRFVVCAAGNEGDGDTVNWPARRHETIAVAAVDRHGRVTAFSSRGREVDVAAPGDEVLSTWPRRRYARLSGTSMATPFVSGVVALMLAKHRQQGGRTPITTVDQLREHLARTATDAGTPGKDPAYGWGLVNPARMLDLDGFDDADEETNRLPALSIDVTVNGQPARLVLAARE